MCNAVGSLLVVCVTVVRGAAGTPLPSDIAWDRNEALYTPPPPPRETQRVVGDLFPQTVKNEASNVGTGQEDDRKRLLESLER